MHSRFTLYSFVGLTVSLSAVLSAAELVLVPRFKLTDLGVLPGTSESQATAISESGVVVGFSGTNVSNQNGQSGGTASGTCTGFIYANGTMTAMDSSTAVAGSPAVLVFPAAVNDSGLIAGDAQKSGFPQPRRFIYQMDGSNSNYLDLTIPLGIYVFGENELGQVVGAGDFTAGVVTPFVWQDGNATHLPGNSGSVAMAVSPNGTYIAGLSFRLRL